MNTLIKNVCSVVLSALVLAPTGLLAVPKTKFVPKAEAGEPTYDSRKDRLPQTQYYTMKPFTLPLMRKGQIIEQFTLVISMELTEEDSRPDLAKWVPRIRDNMYQLLYQMVTFRRRGAPLPDVDMFKERLSNIVKRVAGKHLVKGVLIQLAFKQAVQ